MSRCFNKVILIGFVASEPDFRKASNGTSILTFRIALSESFKTSDGRIVDRDDWFTIVAWRNLAMFRIRFLKKARKCLSKEFCEVELFSFAVARKFKKLKLLPKILSFWMGRKPTKVKKRNRSIFGTLEMTLSYPTFWTKRIESIWVNGEFCNFCIVFAIRQQFAHSFIFIWEDHFRCNFVCWEKDKLSIFGLWMGNRESFGAYLMFAIKYNVEVNFSFVPAWSFFSAQFLFDIFTFVKQFIGSKVCSSNNCNIQEIWLIFETNRFSLVK